MVFIANIVENRAGISQQPFAHSVWPFAPSKNAMPCSHSGLDARADTGPVLFRHFLHCLFTVSTVFR